MFEIPQTYVVVIYISNIQLADGHTRLENGISYFTLIQ